MIKEVTKLFGVDDVRIYPIKKDCEEEYSCARGIELPGVRQVSLTYEIDEKPIEDETKALEITSKIKSIRFYAEDANLKPADAHRINLEQCQIKMQILDKVNGSGDVHIVIYSAGVLTAFDNTNRCSITAIGRYTIHKFKGSQKLLDIEIHDKPKDLEPTESRLKKCKLTTNE